MIVKERTKYKTLYIVTCDVCGAELPPEESFMEAVEAKRENGWKSKKVNGQWEDWCEDCTADTRTGND